ncbi:MAG: O-methyltransferase [Clostridia bacterium]|nr:O-methyltransferase [Clostridia bacterium]
MILDVIKKIKTTAKENFVPIVRDETLLAMLDKIKIVQPKRILEIGTAVGYSALNMLVVSSAEVTTIEKDVARAQQARENFLEAKVGERVKLINGDAIEVLERLTKERETFDFIFLDGPKGQYIKYLPLILQLLTDDGVIFADNVGLLGLVADSEKVTHKNRTMVRNMQAFLQQVKDNKELKTEIFDIDDGYAIIQKIQKNDRKA